MESCLPEPVFSSILIEQNQAHETRKHIIEKIESLLNRPLVTFFTSFRYPVMIEDTDADVLEGIIQKMDLKDGLALLISSPGGLGLAAERIISILRSYSSSKEYWAIVPGKAKSATTMICFGASKIIMGPTSELGPVDPQINISSSNIKMFSVYNLIKSYEILFRKAVSEKGNLEPYLQQLSNYDEREIQEFRSALALSEDISVRTLKTGMLKDADEEEIKEKIKIFLTPEHTKTHGRPIYYEEAKKCDLNIDLIDIKSELWGCLSELYIRTNNFVSNRASKCIESKKHSFSVGVLEDK